MEEKREERMWWRGWSEELERKKRGERGGRGGGVNTVWEKKRKNMFFIYILDNFHKNYYLIPKIEVQDFF